MTEKTQARIAFIGAGRHATESLYPNIAHIPEFDLVAVCDIDESKAIHAARRFGALEHHTDVDKMLAAVKPDGVCICGPGEMHHAVSLQCLSQGFPIFVEKPPAPDVKSAQQLEETAKGHGTWGMVAFMKRFAPANLVAAEVMRGPAFGKLVTISLHHGCGPYDSWYRMMTYNGIHMIDLARFFGGDVTEVSAFVSDAGRNARAALVNLRFASGAIGSLNMNSGHHWTDCTEQVYLGGEGTGVYIDASRATEVMGADRRFVQGEGLRLFGWSDKYYVSGNMAGWWASGHYTRGYWGELSHFARALLGQAPPAPNLADGLAAMRLIEAARISGEQHGQPVRINEVS